MVNDKLFSQAQQAVLEAGNHIKRLRDAGQLEVRIKEDGTPVTNADLESEAIIRRHLEKITPEYGFVSEESAAKAGEGDAQWICDPIDGTRSYKDGEQRYCVSLALQKGKKIVGGIIYNPETQEMFVNDGLETKLNNATLANKSGNHLADATIRYCAPRKQRDGLQDKLKLWQQEGKIKASEPGIGSIAYQLAEIAKGSFGGFVNYHMNKPYDNWDLAAGAQIVRVMGGKVTGLDGKDYEESEMPECMIASANERIHQELLTLTRAAKREEITLGKCA